MLLNTYNHYYTDTHFIFSIFVSMSRPMSIYIVYFIYFHFLPHFIVTDRVTSLKQTHLFFVIFLEYLLFLDYDVDEESE